MPNTVLVTREEPIAVVQINRPTVRNALNDEVMTEIVAALQRAVYQVSLPNRIVLAVKPGEALPSGHPAYGKGLVAGRPAAYVCEGPVCSLPLTDPQALAAALADLR